MAFPDDGHTSNDFFWYFHTWKSDCCSNRRATVFDRRPVDLDVAVLVVSCHFRPSFSRTRPSSAPTKKLSLATIKFECLLVAFGWPGGHTSVIRLSGEKYSNIQQNRERKHWSKSRCWFEWLSSQPVFQQPPHFDWRIVEMPS